RRPRTPVIAGGRPWADSAGGPPEKYRVRSAVRLFHLTHSHRTGRPVAPPSINLTAQGSHALGLQVLALGQETRRDRG
ncbi:hypothetical protein KHP60_23480, partial [Microvirga sp. 3-52]|uniref:hypothetical protein n=1 Tax=Microvirga sp. 3-52 TaxID=2792425 RepID=UPI001BD0516A